MKSPFKKVSVIGLGYIGLPTAAIIAHQGIEVVGIDINPQIVNQINQGKIHIVEPDLEALVHSAISKKTLRASLQMEEADVFIIAVPTPLKEEKKPDLSYIEAAAYSLSKVVKKGNLVILESTSPVGTTEKLRQWLPPIDLKIAYCPERVLPGKILTEIVKNDRIIGGIDLESGKLAQAFYQIFVTAPCHLTDAKTAEMTKLTENAFRDLNIAFANELSYLCDTLQINVWELIRLANRHPRVKILEPGPGVGGHCIAVDPWFLVDSAPQLAKLIKTSREVNDSKPHYILAQVREQIKGIKHPKIACLGLSFKADIDDIRESPALQIVEALAQEKRGELLIVEPHLKDLPPSLHSPHIKKMSSLQEAIALADFVLLLVAHQQFSSFDKTLLKGKKVLDTKGVWTLKNILS